MVAVYLRKYTSLKVFWLLYIPLVVQKDLIADLHDSVIYNTIIRITYNYQNSYRFFNIK